MMCQLLDVVHQTVELPLRIHLPLSAQREAVQPFVIAEVAEHRLHRRKTPAIQRSSPWTVDGRLHPCHRIVGGRVGLASEETHLPRLGLVGGSQTLVSLGTGNTVPLRSLELDGNVTVVDAVRSVLVQGLACRAEAGAGVRIVVKVAGLISLRVLVVVSALVVERIRARLEAVSVLETFIALSHAVVGNQGRDVLFGQRFHIGFRVIARIGGDEGPIGANWCELVRWHG